MIEYNILDGGIRGKLPGEDEDDPAEVVGILKELKMTSQRHTKNANDDDNDEDED